MGRQFLKKFLRLSPFVKNDIIPNRLEIGSSFFFSFFYKYNWLSLGWISFCQSQRIKKKSTVYPSLPRDLLFFMFHKFQYQIYFCPGILKDFHSKIILRNIHFPSNTISRWNNWFKTQGRGSKDLKWEIIYEN